MEGRNLEAGTEAEIIAEHCLLDYILWFTQPAFLYNPEHLPRNGTAHSGLCPPTSIINQENILQACLQANLMEAIPQ